MQYFWGERDLRLYVALGWNSSSTHITSAKHIPDGGERWWSSCYCEPNICIGLGDLQGKI